MHRQTVELPTEATPVILYIIYYLILAMMLAAAFVPQLRIWGLNQWAYYPPFVAFGLFGVGAAVPFLIRPLVKRAAGETDITAAEESHPGMRYWLWASILIIAFALAFYLLRARTHFLGDGYLLLGNLPTVNPWIKIRNLGEEVIHKYIYNLLSGDESARALLSFQLVSFVAGAIFLITTAFASARLFESNSKRLLFFLGLVSSGYMLLFFGYVENYAIFVTTVAIYALMGLLILNGHVRRWYILIPLVAAMFMHTLGVTLIPSTVFLLVAGTRLGSRISRLNRGTRLLVLCGLAVVVLAALGYFYVNSLFFRIALVPLIENRFTIEHYTLFSVKHIADIINLCFLLLPSFPLLLAIGFPVLRRHSSGRDMTFLVILALSTLAAVVLFDPKLGMPRDWDLYAFSGVAFSITAYYALLRYHKSTRVTCPTTALAIFLGFAVLVPRAVGRALGDIEVSHMENYIQLDVKKNKNIVWLIRDHYAAKANTEKVQQIEQQWQRNYPERELNVKGVDLKEKGRYSEAVSYFRAALRENPMHAPTYATLAECYRHMGMYDSAVAMLDLAEGLNPNSADFILERGFLLREQGKYAAAEESFLRALAIDDRNFSGYLGLLELYWNTGQREKHSTLLIRAATHPDAPGVIHARLAYELLTRGMLNEAEMQFRLAISKGMDSTLFEDRLEQIRQMKK